MSAPNLLEANPHILSAIVEAADSKSIVSSRDIYDDRGVKLWAKDQRVSASLQQRLLERKLREPLEACLRAEDGITNIHLVEELDRLLASEHPLAQVLRSHEAMLHQQVRSLPLHSAMQLLLTVSSATRSGGFGHAILGMALAGAMAHSANLDRLSTRLAMLGGLFHDVGEMYIDPAYLNPRTAPGPNEFRHIVAHPAVGAELIRALTDYPAVLAQGVCEHHERLDGTGYPKQVLGSAITPLGRMLAVVEVALGVTAGRVAPLNRASFALRVVPGEFDSRWSGFISRAANGAAKETIGAARELASSTDHDIFELLAQVSASIRCAERVQSSGGVSPVVREVCERVSLRLARLEIAGNSIGLWAGVENATDPEAFERSAALRELRFRMKGIRRECLWSRRELSEVDEQALFPVWDAVSPRPGDGDE